MRLTYLIVGAIVGFTIALIGFSIELHLHWVLVPKTFIKHGGLL